MLLSILNCKAGIFDAEKIEGKIEFKKMLPDYNVLVADCCERDICSSDGGYYIPLECDM
jgi:hypothetical protein